METVMRFLILSILLMLLTGSCGIPRNECHKRVEEIEGAICTEALFAFYALRAAGRDTDADGFSGYVAAVCLVAEQERKNCKDELNIPWFGI